MTNNFKFKKAIQNIYIKSFHSKQDIIWFGKEEELTYFYYHQRRYLSLLNIIKIFPKAKILDIGTSHFTSILKEVYPDTKITTLDLNKSWEKRLENKINQVVFNLNKIENGILLPFESSSFEVIIFNEVIEHLKIVELKKLFLELNRILKKNGVLYLGTPNFASLMNRIKFLIGINPLALTVENKPEYVHIKEYTLGQLCTLLTLSNFTIKQKKYPLYFDIPNKRDHLFIKIKKILFLPLICFYPPFRRGMILKAIKK